MANVFTGKEGKIFAKILSVLRSKLILTQLVYKDFRAEAIQVGADITINVPGTLVQTNATSGVNPPSAQDLKPTVETLSIDQHKDTNFLLTNDQANNFVLNDIIPDAIEESVQVLAQGVNQHILGQYIGIGGHVGTAGTTPFASNGNIAGTLKKELNIQRCPKFGRNLVLDFDAEENATNLVAFTNVDQAGQSHTRVEGEIGRAYGMDWFSDEDIPYHTAGTLSDGAGKDALVKNASGYAIGIADIAVDNTSLTGTVVVGDIFKFTGHNQGYAVTELAIASGNAIASLKFKPPLKAAIVDNEVLTVQPSHRVNLALTEKAIVLVSRLPELQLEGYSSNPDQVLFTDPITGLIFRIQIIRQHNQIHWNVDILYGAKIIRPELGARLLG